MTRAEVEEKFFLNVAQRISGNTAHRIVQLVGGLESLHNIEELTALL